MQFSIYSLLESIGLGIFIFYLIRGLQTKIKGLQGTIDAQNETLKVMEKRIEETEKITNIYKNLISDLPTDIENYKTIVSKTKDATILELKNQNELTKKRLEEAENKIEKSGNTDENIKMHLKILRNLLSAKKTKHRINNEYYLAKIIEASGISLEDSVSYIIQCQTLEEFLEKIGYKVNITEDRSIPDNYFRSQRSPQDEPLFSAFITFSVTGAWHSVLNKNFYTNLIAINELKDEFSSIKTIA